MATQTNGRAPRVPLAAVSAEPAATAAALERAASSVHEALTEAPAKTPELDAAVLRVQAAAPTLIRNATGQIQSRTYGYVTNDAVVDAVLPLLVEEKLLWRAYPTTHADGSPALRYRMTHVTSGESDEDVMKLCAIPDPQGQGSGLTYARRYSLVAYLNLTVDPDDDGGRGTAPPVQPNAQVEPQSRPQAAEPKPSGRPATVKQRNLIKARACEAGLTAAQLADVVLVATGNEPRRMDEEAAERWLARGLDRLPGRKAVVDAVLSGIANHPPF